MNKQSSISDSQVDPKKEQVEQKQKQVKPEFQQVERKPEPASSNTWQPTQQLQNPSTQETDEEYARRILSSKDYLVALMSCAQLPQKCDLLLEIIQKRDSRLFSVHSWYFSYCSALLRIRPFLSMQL